MRHFRCAMVALGGLLLIVSFSTAARAASTYQETVLTSDIPGLGINPTDPNLLNPWGFGFTATSPFWTGNQASGTTTLYASPNGAANATGPITIPGGGGTTAGSPGPTGVVNNGANANGDGVTGNSFTIIGQTPTPAVASFIFDNLNGTISAWNGGIGNHGTAAIEVTTPGASYTGLAIANNGTQDLLYAADNAAGSGHAMISVFQQTSSTVAWSQVTLPGNFVDPMVAPGTAPYNIQFLNGQLYVTYQTRRDRLDLRIQPGRHRVTGTSRPATDLKCLGHSAGSRGLRLVRWRSARRQQDRRPDQRIQPHHVCLPRITHGPDRQCDFNSRHLGDRLSRSQLRVRPEHALFRRRGQRDRRQLLHARRIRLDRVGPGAFLGDPPRLGPDRPLRLLLPAGVAAPLPGQAGTGGWSRLGLISPGEIRTTQAESQLARRSFGHRMLDSGTGRTGPDLGSVQVRDGSIRPGSLAVMPLRGFLSVGHARKDCLRATDPLVSARRSPDPGRVGPLPGPCQNDPLLGAFDPERGDSGLCLRDTLVHAPRESTAQVVFLRSRCGTRRTTLGMLRCAPTRAMKFGASFQRLEAFRWNSSTK